MTGSDVLHLNQTKLQCPEEKATVVAVCEEATQFNSLIRVHARDGQHDFQTILFQMKLFLGKLFIH